MASKTNQNDWASLLSKLETNLELYLGQKAPSLPKNIKELIVKFSPWIALVAAIFSLPAILAILGLGSAFVPFSYIGGFRVGFTYTISMFILGASVVVSFMAIPGLFKQQAKAWRLMYYAALLNALHSILVFNLGNLLIGSLISFYVLFQIKSYYKK